MYKRRGILNCYVGTSTRICRLADADDIVEEVLTAWREKAGGKVAARLS
jgi:hypothetical protein